MDMDGVDPASRPAGCCPIDMMDCQAFEDSVLMAMPLGYHRMRVWDAGTGTLERGGGRGVGLSQGCSFRKSW